MLGKETALLAKAKKVQDISSVLQIYIPFLGLSNFSGDQSKQPLLIAKTINFKL